MCGRREPGRRRTADGGRRTADGGRRTAWCTSAAWCLVALLLHARAGGTTCDGRSVATRWWVYLIDTIDNTIATASPSPQRHHACHIDGPHECPVHSDSDSACHPLVRLSLAPAPEQLQRPHQARNCRQEAGEWHEVSAALRLQPSLPQKSAHCVPDGVTPAHHRDPGYERATLRDVQSQLPYSAHQAQHEGCVHGAAGVRSAELLLGSDATRGGQGLTAASHERAEKKYADGMAAQPSSLLQALRGRPTPC